MPSKAKSDQMTEPEAVREIYAALNRNDIRGALELFASGAFREEPSDFPTPGIYRGHSELFEHFTKGRAAWAEGRCEPEKITVAGDRIVVDVHVHVRLKNETRWIDARIADGFVFKNGQVVEMRSFLTVKQARDGAGVRE